MTITTQRPAELLSHIYAAMDERRFDDLPAFFTADVTGTTAGGSFTGLDRLVAQASRNHERLPNLQHLVTDVIETPTGDGVELRANLVVVFADEGGAPTLELGEVWRGTAVAGHDGWRIRSFEISLVWMRGERPA